MTTSTSEDKTTTEELKEAIVDDEQPIDKKVPGAAFSVVTLSYLVVLIIAMAVLGFLFWWFGAESPPNGTV
ncbi:hypothetical protein [Allorhodopirellula heiligendammensis]|uniref:Uncharacterized protein n=1 Tax=Allorhodopirellula heiligendammensis TaxID=2714739 RepID=A0A5C6C2I6_9BACT|nr:hypothetical protein [Allorhodopirellula heiligendammensis]TWU18392.1 hypothetical protein Poly21_05540 [Allorhodopirellula heiligendammensis]